MGTGRHPTEDEDGAGAIPDDVPIFENPVEYADFSVTERAVAVAEPMTTHDATLVALGDNVRQVTQLIESVGRTLEAQEQRSLRLMQRLETVARALETLPEEADRNLEGLGAIEEAILSQRKPLDSLSQRLCEIPDIARAMRETNESARELWSSATRAMASRMAFTAHEEHMREWRETSRRRWRVLAGAALAIAAFFGGAAMTATDVASEVRRGIAAVFTADRPVVEAHEGERAWRVMDVRRLEQLPLPPKAATKRVQAQPEEPLGTDEEAR